MRLLINSELHYRFPEPCEVLLLIEAAHSPDQAVASEQFDVSPSMEVFRLDDPGTGERRVVMKASGEVKVTYQAVVDLDRPEPELAGVAAVAISDLPPEALTFLRPSRYCPSDRFHSFVERQFGDLSGGDKVAAILTWIETHLDYRPGASDGATTALETFVDRAGVCRDFAHLTVALCRAADIPARAVSAYAWKLEPPDMHAVAEVYLEGGWRLVDATGLAPISGMVRVATGLDAADIAFMSIFGSAEMLDQSFSVAEAA
jgi:transglutaminase-like putative cysteine protease